MRAIFASRHVDRSVVDGAGGGKINLYLNFHINFPSCSLGWSFLSDDEVTLLSALLLKTCTMQSGNSIRTECDFILSPAADDDMKLKFKKMFPSGLRRTGHRQRRRRQVDLRFLCFSDRSVWEARHHPWCAADDDVSSICDARTWPVSPASAAEALGK